MHDWCTSRTRTNVEIDDGLVRTIMDRFGLHTKTEAVDLALRSLAGRWMSPEDIVAMHGANAIGDVPADVGLAE